MSQVDRVVRALLGRPGLARDVRNELNRRKFAYPWETIKGSILVRKVDGIEIVVRIEQRGGTWGIEFVRPNGSRFEGQFDSADEAKANADKILAESDYILVDTPDTRPKVVLQWCVTGTDRNGTSRAWARTDVHENIVAWIARVPNKIYWTIRELPRRDFTDHGELPANAGDPRDAKAHVDALLVDAGWTLLD